MQIKTRRADQRDITLIKMLHLRIFHEIGETNKSFNRILTKKDVIILVSESVDRNSKKLIGYAICIQKGKALHWGWLGVLPAYRQNGCASKLLRKTQTEASRLGCKHIVLETRNRFKNALIFYITNGFSIDRCFKNKRDSDVMIQLSMKEP